MDQSPIRFDRLRTLYDFLSALKPEQMDMDHVVVNFKDVDFDLVKAGYAKECGAIGCALGWAGLMPEFRKEGLKYTRKGVIKIRGTQIEYADAGATFFGLTGRQAAWMFGPLRTEEHGMSDQAAFQLRCRSFFSLCDEPF